MRCFYQRNDGMMSAARQRSNRRGKGIVKQHQMVNKLLGEEVAKWHGFSLTTKAPEAPAPQK